jgi:hypothetical protein
MLHKFPKRANFWVLLTILATLFFLILARALDQDQSYHAFADQRTFLGIAAFGDVISNLRFVIVGLIGPFTLAAGLPVRGRIRAESANASAARRYGSDLAVGSRFASLTVPELDLKPEHP